MLYNREKETTTCLGNVQKWILPSLFFFLEVIDMGRRRHCINKNPNIDEFPVQEQNGPETKYGTVVNTQFVNLRVAPSYTAEVVDILPKGAKVKILEKLENRGFYKIKVESIPKKIHYPNDIKHLDGVYISSNFLTEE